MRRKIKITGNFTNLFVLYFLSIEFDGDRKLGSRQKSRAKKRALKAIAKEERLAKKQKTVSTQEAKGKRSFVSIFKCCQYCTYELPTQQL